MLDFGAAACQIIGAIKMKEEVMATTDDILQLGERIKAVRHGRSHESVDGTRYREITLEIEMNKQEAMKEYNELSEAINACVFKQTELKKIIDAPDAPGSLLPSFNMAREMPLMNFHFPVMDEKPFPHIRIWSDWRAAFQTFIELRQQPGSEPPEDGKMQWSCGCAEELDEGQSYLAVDVKITRLIPCFDTQLNYQNAIQTVTPDRILQMMRTFQGVK